MIELKEACEKTLNSWEQYEGILKATYPSEQIVRQIKHSLKGLFEGLEGHIICDQDDISDKEEIMPMPLLMEYSTVSEGPSRYQTPDYLQRKQSHFSKAEASANNEEHKSHTKKISSLQD